MVENMINDFPSIIDSKEFVAASLYSNNKPDNRKACQGAMDQILYIMSNDIINNYVIRAERFKVKK